MLIYDSFPFKQTLKEKQDRKRAIALGFFDGVHLGHQELIKQVLKVSAEQNITPSIFTFEARPSSLIKPKKKFPGFIQNTAMRLETFKKFKIEETFLVSLDDKFRQITAADFYYQILCADLNLKALVVGQDAHFGYLGQGNIEKLKKWTKQTNVELFIVPDVKINNVKVSSTYIRQLLKAGKIKLANRCLGQPYKRKGKVIHGKKLGRTLGFPTINLTYEKELMKPKFGVYMTNVILQNKKYPAITSIGTNPTVETNNEVKIETFIYDQDFDLYDETVYIEFLEFIRPEIKFSTIKQMTQRIKLDLDFVEAKHQINNS